MYAYFVFVNILQRYSLISTSLHISVAEAEPKKESNLLEGLLPAFAKIMPCPAHIFFFVVEIRHSSSVRNIFNKQGPLRTDVTSFANIANKLENLRITHRNPQLFFFWYLAIWTLFKIDSEAELLIIPPPLFLRRKYSGRPNTWPTQSTIMF